MCPCQDVVVDLPRLQLPSAYFHYAELDMELKRVNRREKR